MPRRGAISWRRSARADAVGPATGVESDPGLVSGSDPDALRDRSRDEIAVDFLHMAPIVDRMKSGFRESED